jgi:hypothetical protein
MMQTLKATAWLLACIPLAAGHGGGMVYTIDGVVHPGCVPKRNSRCSNLMRHLSSPFQITPERAKQQDGEYSACVDMGRQILV